MIQPLFNHCLIEVIDEYAGILRDNTTEDRQKGKLISYDVTHDHLTASTGYTLAGYVEYGEMLESLVNKIVYWQNFADTGMQFNEDGKLYSMVPWYRLVGFEDNKGEK